MGDQGLNSALLVTLGGNLWHDLVLAFFKDYLATDRSISTPMGWPDSANVVPNLTSLFSYDEVETELIWALQAFEVPCVQLELKSAFRAFHGVQTAT